MVCSEAWRLDPVHWRSSSPTLDVVQTLGVASISSQLPVYLSWFRIKTKSFSATASSHVTSVTQLVPIASRGAGYGNLLKQRPESKVKGRKDQEGKPALAYASPVHKWFLMATQLYTPILVLFL